VSNDVASFVARCTRHPAAVTPVKALFRQFGESLPEAKRSGWSRSNFLFELGRAGFYLSQIGNSDVVIGLGPPAGGWTIRDGRLVFVS
jgi:hypothetical protein